MEKQCPYCGEPIAEEAEFCLACFTRFTKIQKLETEAAARVSVSSRPPQKDRAARQMLLLRCLSSVFFLLLCSCVLFRPESFYGAGIKPPFPDFTLEFSFSPLKTPSLITPSLKAPVSPKPTMQKSDPPDSGTPYITEKITSTPTPHSSTPNSPTPQETLPEFSGHPYAPASDFTYTISEKGVRIDGYHGKAETLRIPDTIALRPVTEIAEQAFYANRYIRQLEIPGSAVQIGARAFSSCARLELIYIPESVTRIGEGAFSYCKRLSAVMLPDCLTTLKPYVFEGCTALTKITLPKDLKDMYFNAFSRTSITELTLPASLVMIRDLDRDPIDFPELPKLKKVEVAPGNIVYYAEDGVLFHSSGTLLIYPANRGKSSYAVPSGTRQIESAAFRDNQQLSTILLPEGLERIGQFAFGDCKNLTGLHLPESVVEIDMCAFCDTAITEMYFPSSLIKLGTMPFSGCNDLKRIYLPAEITSMPEPEYFFPSGVSIYPYRVSIYVLENTKMHDYVKECGVPYEFYQR